MSSNRHGRRYYRSSKFSLVSPFAPFARFLFAATGAGLMILPALAAHASDPAQAAREYEQVRKIALKDSKVQAAFEKANEKLDDRIIEIDPSLKPYVEKRRSQATAAAAKPSPSQAPKPAVAKKSAPATVTSATHVVAKGETLSSIALQYKVSVASLKSANNITDERKLKVGQKLVIPNAKAAAESTGSEPSLWDRLKSSL